MCAHCLGIRRLGIDQKILISSRELAGPSQGQKKSSLNAFCQRPELLDLYQAVLRVPAFLERMLHRAQLRARNPKPSHRRD